MTNISRISHQQLRTIDAKKLKQDIPQQNTVYSNVYRSEGKAEETIQAILYFAKKQIGDKEEKGNNQNRNKNNKNKKDEKGKNKKVDESQFDENKTYVISSPVLETMQQPRKNGCASTSLAMLLRKYGSVSSVQEGYAKVETLKNQGAKNLNDTGMSLENISTYAQMLGLKARIQRGENFISQLEGLLRALNIGATPIASIQLPGMGTMRHAVLVIGISNKNVTIIDPAEIDVKEISIPEFQKCWAKQDVASYGVGLAYVEVWGAKPAGKVFQEMDWLSVFDEFTKDKLSFSNNIKRSDVIPIIKLFPDWD